MHSFIHYCRKFITFSKCLGFALIDNFVVIHYDNSSPSKYEENKMDSTLHILLF